LEGRGVRGRVREVVWGKGKRGGGEAQKRVLWIWTSFGREAVLKGE